MKTWQIGLVVAGTLSLASCNSLIQKAADNTAVSVIPLADAELTGTMEAQSAAALGLRAQANRLTTLTSDSISFGDFDPDTLPAALRTPKGLDIPIVIKSATLSCTASVNPLTMTVRGITLTVSDGPNGSQSVSVSPNTVLTLTKTSTGYSVSSTEMILNAQWSIFKSIVVSKKGSPNSVNKAVLKLFVTFNDGATGCKVTIKLSSP